MTHPVRIGIIGFGLATDPVMGPLQRHGGYALVGCADVDPLSRARFESTFGGPAYDDARQLLEVEKPDVVYIATPTRLHEEAAVAAFELGIHVLVEKPIATTTAAALRMIDAAKRNGRTLMVNHKRSADREIVAMRLLISSGELGGVVSANRWHLSDWFYRARAAEELRPPHGGVVLRQGAHEFDILRAVLPSTPVRVRAWIGDHDRARRGEGAYHAWIECADGTVATSLYSGYDRFPSEELSGALLPPDVVGASYRNLAENAPTAALEHDLKRTVGHPRAPARSSGPYGFTLVCCEGGDLRAAPGGRVLRYDHGGRREVSVTGVAGTGLIVEELYQAVVNGVAPMHDGAWGLACLELCLAVREAAEAGGNAVPLEHQQTVDVAAGLHSDHRLEFAG